jgi:putative membrane protein
MGRELVMDVFPLYFLYTIIIVLIIALIFYWLIHTARRKETALDILKKRYAGGEIGKETFDQMKKDLAE